jgi:creatinine amidohydrolase
MRFEDLNWMDIERYLQNDDRIILVTGATKQHAYLSLLTDTLIPSKIALAVAEQEHILLAPSLPYGGGNYQFAGYPGTINVSTQTFHALLNEVVESLLHQGFLRFFIFNGSPGNELPPHLEELQFERLIHIVWYDWWRTSAMRAFEEQHSLRMEHANWGENFAFTRVAEVPQEEKPMVDPVYMDDETAVRNMLGDGSYGGLYQIDDALMQDLFAALVEEAVELVRTPSGV